MQNKKIIVLLPVFLLLWTQTHAQKGYYQLSVGGGYEHFTQMYKSAGWNLNIDGKYHITDYWYAAATLHCGVNNGTKTEYHEVYGITEKYRLDNTLREYLLGIGPGVNFLRDGNRWAYLHALIGYGWGEELKSEWGNNVPENIPVSFRNGLGGAISLGYDYQPNSWIFGAALNTYYIGDRINVSLNLKVGFFLSGIIF